MAFEDEEKKQYMVIKIKKPHHAERLGWIVLIALLLTIILFQWISFAGSECADVEASVNEETETVEKSESETQKPEEKTLTEVPKEEQKKELSEGTEAKKLSGRMEFEILSVSAEKKKENLGKINSIKYSIDNQKEDFVPLIRFYLFDSQWTEDQYTASLLKKCCEQTPLYSLPLKAGAPKYENYFTPNFPSVMDLNETKTIKLEVYDKDTETLVAAGEYQLKKDSWK